MIKLIFGDDFKCFFYGSFYNDFVIRLFYVILQMKNVHIYR